MKMLLLVKTILIWALVPMAWASPCVSPDEGEIVHLEIGSSATKDGYKHVMTTLRNTLKSDKIYYGIPMLPKPSVPSNRFIYVELRVTQDVSITLGINKDDLYVEGYCDKYEGNYRARFFKTARPTAKQQLFPKVEKPYRKDMSYGGDYPSIMKIAKTGKSKAGLGIRNVKSLVEEVFGKAINEQVEAKFLLVAIQMVSEAVRFKYIEDQVVEYFDYPKFTPDCKLLKLLNSWGLISRAFKNSKTGTINIKLTDADGKDWQVTNVKDIAPDLGILSYVDDKAQASMVSRFLNLFVGRGSNDSEL